MSNLTNNTAELRDILAAVNALPEASGSGGITPSGTKQITANGEYDVTNYAKANVNVPNTGGGSASSSAENAILMKTLEGEYVNNTVTIIAQNVLRENKSLTSVKLPAVKTVMSYAFTACTNLTTAEFWVLELMQAYAFSLCSNLSALILRNTKTVCNMVAVSALNSSSFNGYIYVPKTLVDSYKAASNWSNYASKIRAIEDYPDITGG